VTFLKGDRIYEALLTVGSGDQESPRRRMEQETSKLETRRQELEAARRDLLRARAELEESWQQRLADGLPARNRLPDRWQEFREFILVACETAAIAGVVSDGLSSDRAELAKKGEELRSEESATRWYLVLRRWIRGLLGMALLGLTWWLDQGPAPPATDDPARFGFRLVESSAALGIDFRHEGPRLDPRLANVEAHVTGIGAAVSVSDVDGDGRPDLYAVTSRLGRPNALYVNRGDGRFEDRAAEAGLADLNVAGRGASMALADRLQSAPCLPAAGQRRRHRYCLGTLHASSPAGFRTRMVGKNTRT